MTGQILDLSDAEYFARTELSHSDTKHLDPPARLKHLRDNPRYASPPTADMLFGSAVHSFVLGGPCIYSIDADDWKLKATREERDTHLANGDIPLLRDDWQRAEACAAALHEHPLASKLLANLERTEFTCLWEHDGVGLRAKLDGQTGRFGIDLKTTYNADTEAFGRSAGKYGYASQAAFYMEALRHCAGVDNPGFLFIVVEKEPPFLVNVVQLDDYAVELGHRRNLAKIAVYRRCVETGVWPGYPDGINVASLPRWAEIDMEAAA